MPEISRFYGIIIQIYYGDHPPPHFHALYAGAVAKIAIGTLEIIGGSLPRRALSPTLDLIGRPFISRNFSKHSIAPPRSKRPAKLHP